MWFLLMGFVQAAFAERATTTHPVPRTAGEILPCDVLARVGLLRDELELIRLEMGKAKDRKPDFPVANAAPREVYFQAMILYSKADRLAQDLTGSEPTQLDQLSADMLGPQDVWATVDAALARLLIIKKRIGITETCLEQRMPDDTQPNDVFQSIVHANRQLNLLLHPEIAPSDAFRQVETAVNYTDRLLDTFPDSHSQVGPPPLLRGKRSDDVYRCLVDCFTLIEKVAKLSNIAMMRVDWTDEHICDATSSDVVDLTSLLVSELAYLHSLKKGDALAAVHYPGRCFPSHVFQKAGALEAKLQELARQVERIPGWLTPKDANRE